MVARPIAWLFAICALLVFVTTAGFRVLGLIGALLIADRHSARLLLRYLGGVVGIVLFCHRYEQQ